MKQGISNVDTILIVSPHTDDGELGCGGSIAKLVEEGNDIHYVAFSYAGKDTLKKEVKESTEVLNIDSNNVHLFEFETRHFPEHRQEILDALIRLRNEIKPEMVFIPASVDVHQDHQVIMSEALRAFKKTALSILGYEEPWNCFTFSTTVFVSLQEKHIKTKIAAVKKYKSQKDKDYMSEDFIRGLARTRGTQIGVEYAEAFEIMRWVIK